MNTKSPKRRMLKAGAAVVTLTAVLMGSWGLLLAVERGERSNGAGADGWAFHSRSRRARGLIAREGQLAGALRP